MLHSLIEEKVRHAFKIFYFELQNESHMHLRGEPESHFKMILVSNDFEGMVKVKRHQFVYRVLSELMPEFHALALHLYTEAEWQCLAHTPESSYCSGEH